MKIVTNTSMQSWSLPIRTPAGIKTHYLTPKSSVQIPDSYVTDHLQRYEQRQLITIKTV